MKNNKKNKKNKLVTGCGICFVLYREKHEENDHGESENENDCDEANEICIEIITIYSFYYETRRSIT